MMETNDVIYGINGPVVTVRNTRSFSMMEMVYVGEGQDMEVYAEGPQS